VLLLTLVVFAFDVPMIVAFTVARYQEAAPADESKDLSLQSG
jgi:hypothetical protein